MVCLNVSVQDVQGTHGFDCGVNPFDKRDRLTAGSVILFQVEVSSSDLLGFGRVHFDYACESLIVLDNDLKGMNSSK